jgi:hypothetical protein
MFIMNSIIRQNKKRKLEIDEQFKWLLTSTLMDSLAIHNIRYCMPQKLMALS